MHTRHCQTKYLSRDLSFITISKKKVRSLSSLLMDMSQWWPTEDRDIKIWIPIYLANVEPMIPKMWSKCIIWKHFLKHCIHLMDCYWGWETKGTRIKLISLSPKAFQYRQQDIYQNAFIVKAQGACVSRRKGSGWGRVGGRKGGRKQSGTEK